MDAELTEFEQLVFDMVCEDKTNVEIAEETGRNVSYIKTLCSKISAKVGEAWPREDRHWNYRNQDIKSSPADKEIRMSYAPATVRYSAARVRANKAMLALTAALSGLREPQEPREQTIVSMNNLTGLLDEACDCITAMQKGIERHG